MWEVVEKDFEVIRGWNLDKEPFSAVKDFSFLKTELRWMNKENVEAYEKYVEARNNYIQNKDFDDYYRRAEKPIDKERWDYLKNRKAWYIMPLGWNQIVKSGGSVVDIGCGDGDTVQRLVDFVDNQWKEEGASNKSLNIIGIDLNDSRVRNARQHVKTTNANITFEFRQADLTKNLGEFSQDQFDFSLCCGVLEILDDKQFELLMNNMAKITKNSIYIEDLFEKYPGGYPRDSLGKELIERGFVTREREVVMSEPFSTEKLQDPKRIWPIFIVQNIWAEKIG